jgi:hypothetical protein
MHHHHAHAPRLIRTAYTARLAVCDRVMPVLALIAAGVPVGALLALLGI